MEDQVHLLSEYVIKMKDLIDERKVKWHTEIMANLKGIGNKPEALPEVQAELISMRQRLTDEINFITSQIAKENSRLKKQKSDKFVYYSTGVLPDGSKATGKSSIRDMNIISLKKTKGELDIILSGDLCDLEELLDTFISYQVFLKESVKSIDHSLYGIKNRIELLNILMGINYK